MNHKIMKTWFIGRNCYVVRGYLSLPSPLLCRSILCLSSYSKQPLQRHISPSFSRRYYSNESQWHSATPDNSSTKLINQWNTKVAKFGHLYLQSYIKTTVKPIDPFSIPEGDQAIVSLIATGKDENEFAAHRDKLKNTLKNGVSFDWDQRRLTVNWPKDISDNFVEDYLELYIEIPFPYDVCCVHKSRNPIHIERLENNDISIESLQGDITFKNLKCSKVNLKTHGEITSNGYLLGDAHLQCLGPGGINIRKIQGNHAHLSTTGGNINATAVYGQTIKCLSESGKISILSSHGHLKCSTLAGNIELASVSGSAEITTATGCIAITLDRIDSLSIQNQQSDIHLRVPENAGTRISSTSKATEVDSNIDFRVFRLATTDSQTTLSGEIGDGKGIVTMAAPKGNIKISKNDWLTSITIIRSF